MAVPSFGLKFGVEDKREFKRAITNINREMRALRPTHSWSMASYSPRPSYTDPIDPLPKTGVRPC